MVFDLTNGTFRDRPLIVKVEVSSGKPVSLVALL
jgi:hypothetical protein